MCPHQRCPMAARRGRLVSWGRKPSNMLCSGLVRSWECPIRGEEGTFGGLAREWIAVACRHVWFRLLGFDALCLCRGRGLASSVVGRPVHRRTSVAPLASPAWGTIRCSCQGVPGPPRGDDPLRDSCHRPLSGRQRHWARIGVDYEIPCGMAPRLRCMSGFMSSSCWAQ